MTSSWAPAEREIGRRRAGLPHVLADRGPDEHVAEAQQHEVATRGEVAVLVEDAVVGEEVLPVDGHHPAVCADGAGVCQVAIEERHADQRDGRRAGPGDLVERPRGGLDEARAQEQVLGRVAGDRELGKHDEVCTCGLRLAQMVEHAIAVAVEVADDGVQLGQRDPHGAILVLTGCERQRTCFRLIVANVTLPA